MYQPFWFISYREINERYIKKIILCYIQFICKHKPYLSFFFVIVTYVFVHYSREDFPFVNLRRKRPCPTNWRPVNGSVSVGCSGCQTSLGCIAPCNGRRGGPGSPTARGYSSVLLLPPIVPGPTGLSGLPCRLHACLCACKGHNNWSSHILLRWP